MVQTLYPDGGAVYQHENAPIHTARQETEWFDEHESEAEHLSFWAFNSLRLHHSLSLSVT